MYVHMFYFGFLVEFCYTAICWHLPLIHLFLIQRAADTGWGAEEDRHSRWVQDKFEGRTGRANHTSGFPPAEAHKNNDKHFRTKATETGRERLRDSKRLHTNHSEQKDSMEEREYRNEKRSRKYGSESYHEDKYGRDRSSRPGCDSRHHHRVRKREGDE